MRALPLLGLGLVHLTFAAAVWRAKSDNRVNRLFAVQTLLLAGWTFGVALLQHSAWLRAGNILTFGSASLIPAGLLTFTSHYPSPKARTPWELRAVCMIGLMFAVLSCTELMVYDLQTGPDGPSRKPGPAYPVFVVYFAAVYAAALLLFTRKWWRARGRERTQLNYYGVGLAVVSLFGTSANLFIPALTGRSTVSHVGPWFAIPLIALTAHAIVRHRFLDLKFVIHRGMTASIAAVVSLVPFTVLLLLASGRTLEELTWLEAALICGAAVASMALVPRIRQAAEDLLDRYVYRSTTNPHRALREASVALTTARDSRTVATVISDTIGLAVNPEGVATYLEDDGRFRPMDTRRVDGGTFRPGPAPPEHIVEEARRSRRPILLDELETVSQWQLHHDLKRAGWALVLPLLAGERLVGLVAVGPKLSGEPFYSQDIDALTTLANHAGSAVHNATLHAEVVLANQYVGSIVDAMQNGVVAVDRLSNVSLHNPAARLLLGISGGESLAIDDLPPPLRDMLREVLEGGIEHITREFEVPSAAHAALSLFCTSSLLRDHEGKHVGAVAVFSDMTPSKELDRQRARAEKLSALQNLTYALAHEIGNPLVPIKTMTKLLPDRLGDMEFVKNVARIVPRELERIERLVARLRRVAPREEAIHVRTDLRVPMRHAIEVLEATAAAQQTGLHVSLPTVPVMISGDSAELEELFLNLLTNALEALSEKREGTRAIEVAVDVEESTAVTKISDTGPGVPPKLLASVFDLFVTSKPRGSGLGLSICARIAEAHGGRIAVANQPAGGATVTVTLPLISGS